jgi:site-specific DNA recombinase
MASNGKDRSGRIRILCSAATESGICPDPKTFYLETVEAAVLNGLTTELRHPDVIAEYVRTYHAERKRLAADADRKRARLERRLGDLTREIDRLVDAIAKGLGDPAVLGPRSTILDGERKTVAAELAEATPAAEVVALHPAMLARYEERLTRLSAALADGISDGDTEGDPGLGRDRHDLSGRLASRRRPGRSLRSPDRLARRAGVSQPGPWSVG